MICVAARHCSLLWIQSQLWAAIQGYGLEGLTREGSSKGECLQGRKYCWVKLQALSARFNVDTSPI